MTDHIVLGGMCFEGRVGVTEEERAEPQLIEVDVELELDLRPAGTSDDLAQTVNYADVFEVCRAQVEGGTTNLLEAVAEAIAGEVLARFVAVNGVVVAARKPGVPIDGVLDYAGVRIERRRAA